MSAFSPGPYRAQKGAEGEPERWVVVADGPVPYLIATIENGQPGDMLETEEATAKLFAAAPELLSILRSLATNPHLNLGDQVYAVRESEGEGWEGPAVKAWSEAVTAAKDMLARFPDAPAEEPKRMLVQHQEFTAPGVPGVGGIRWKWDGVTLFVLEGQGWVKSNFANPEELKSMVNDVTEIP